MPNWLLFTIIFSVSVLATVGLEKLIYLCSDRYKRRKNWKKAKEVRIP